MGNSVSFKKPLVSILKPRKNKLDISKILKLKPISILKQKTKKPKK